MFTLFNSCFTTIVIYILTNMFNVFFLNVLNSAMWMYEVSYYVCYFFVFDCLSVMCMWAIHIVYCVLLISATVVLYCMDLIACCNPASIMTRSISSLVFTDNGSVKLCMNVNLNVNVHTARFPFTGYMRPRNITKSIADNNKHLTELPPPFSNKWKKRVH